MSTCPYYSFFVGKELEERKGKERKGMTHGRPKRGNETDLRDRWFIHTIHID
jgi:hypothetical protein